MVATVFGVLRPLLSTRERRDVLIALSSAYMLVQLSSLPVALSIPTLAEHFGASIGDVAWMVVVYLMMLGGLVMLMARLGDKYGHANVFFIGIVIATIGSVALDLLPRAVAPDCAPRPDGARFRDGHGQRERHTCRRVSA